jgi:dihydropyrimidinase
VLIRGGTVIDLDGERVADVRMVSERVAAVGTLAPMNDETIYDAHGCYVIPGGVDAHTHLHLPVGAVRVSDDFDTGTRAAAIGGTTTVIDYVTAYRGEDPMAALRTWKAWAEPSVTDYGLHMTFTEMVPERSVAECVEAGVTSIKLYMAYPELLQVDDDTIRTILGYAHKHGALVTLHAENGGEIERLRRAALATGRTGVFEHATTRPAQLEAEATDRAARMAEEVGAAVYIVHLSSAPALASVRAAQERGVDLFVETCPQYLHLDASALRGTDGEHFVCTPPLRDPWHHDELWHGLASGWIHTVATDHCPFWMHDRSTGTRPGAEHFADFTEIPGGLPGIETRLALIYDGVRAEHITRADWVRLCAEAPAKLFGLWPAKGSLRIGADADIVVWDPQLQQSLDAAALHMRVDHSPYAGRTSVGWPRLVFGRGRLVAHNGEFVGEPAAGRFLERSQPRFR